MNENLTLPKSGGNKSVTPPLCFWVKRHFIKLFAMTILMVVSAINPTLAQNRKLTGSVVDVKGSPIAGANIIVAGTNNGTVANIDGYFTINVSGAVKLKASFVGYSTQEIAVSPSEKQVKIILKENMALEEIVVVGYGTQKKVTLTGAVASIGNAELVATKTQNIQNMMTGKIPGVRVVQKTSEPGSFTNTFDIRGFGSPLVVIDGVPRENITRLDPNEIESISVLKDASAAIYGMRAGNGVVLITTKKGQKNSKLQIEYQYYWGAQQASGLPNPVDAVKRMTLANEKSMHNPDNQKWAYSQEEIDAYRSGELQSTDWYGVVMDKFAPQQQHNLSFSGGSDKINYYVNMGYMDQTGFWKSDDLNYKRYNIRSNIDVQITKRLKASLNVTGIMDEKNQPYKDSWEVFKELWRHQPNQTVYANNNPDYLLLPFASEHALALSDKDYSGYKINNNKWFQSLLTLEYEIPYVKGLTAKGQFSYDFDITDNKQFQKTYSLYSYDATNDIYKPTVKNSVDQLRREYYARPQTLLQASLNYTRVFNEKHNVGALLLYEETTRSRDNFYAQRELGLPLDQIIAGLADNQQGYLSTSNLWNQANKGLAGRVNYDYMSKYIGEFSFRYDGSSKFPTNKQWGFFPSVSVGWRISEENFIKNVDQLSFINNIKLRASYGEMGDDGASSYQFITGYDYPYGGNAKKLPSGSYFDGKFYNAVNFKNLPNNNITWYTLTTLNVGLDVDMWDGLFSFSFDAFKRTRSGLLATRNVSLPGTFGATMPQENLNKDQGIGFELLVSHKNKINDFTYSVSANMSMVRTKTLFTERGPFGNSFDMWRNGSAGRYNDLWWGYGYEGQYQSYQDIENSGAFVARGALPGDYVYEDWNGDGTIDGSDYYPIATKNAPKMFFGLTLSAEYKGFDFSALFQGAAMVNTAFPEQMSQPLAWNGNALEQYMDRWHPADPKADPYNVNTEWIKGRFAYSGTLHQMNSEFAVEDATYIRLKSIELGYTLPYRWTQKIGLKRTRIFVSGYNLFTLCGIPFIDPEHPSDSYGYVYPLNKTYNVGISVTF